MPAAALGDLAAEWPGLRQIARITRLRQVKKDGAWTNPVPESAWLITSLDPEGSSPETLLTFNRKHWRIENNLHWNKDVLLGEDTLTNHCGHAPRNMASFNNLTLAVYKSVNPSPKRAMEAFQNDRNRAISMW